MLDHLGIHTARYAEAYRFYTEALQVIGAEEKYRVPLEHSGGRHVVGFGRDWAVFWLHEADQGAAISGIHIAFAARNRAEVDAFFRAALAAGGRDNGPPGLRPQYHPDYYGAFVVDPDGNNVEACYQFPVEPA